MLERPPSVFVIEDDQFVQELIKAVLEQAGFQVAQASTVWSALDVLEKEEFDLSIVDIGLPGDFDGVDLVQCIRAKRPQMRCLFISGYSQPVTDDPDRDDFVRKPFRPHELLGCVWELLQRRVPDGQIDLPRRHEQRMSVAAEIEERRSIDGPELVSRAGTRRASGRARLRKAC